LLHEKRTIEKLISITIESLICNFWAYPVDSALNVTIYWLSF